MICDNCGKKEAVFHSKTNINGKVTETHLCEDCLKKSQYINDVNNSFENDFDFFNDDPFFTDNSLLGNFISNSPYSNKKSNLDYRCPSCGCSFENFSQRGLLGCAKCYDYFNKKLMPIISNMQFGTKHLGKNYEQTSVEETKEDKIAELRRKLKLAVDEENYELASEIKKQITSLEAKNE